MSTRRKHHFVPRFYLAGFTPSGSKEDQLYVLDKSTEGQWQSSPGKAACEKDFYILEVEDEGDPLALEKLFGRIETDGADAIRSVIEQKCVPTGDLFNKLVSFLGIMAVRSPGNLDAIEGPFAQIAKSMLCQATYSKERWEALVEDLKKKGQDVGETSWEEMRDFVRSDDCVITMGQNWKMSTILETMALSAQLLSKRTWSLVEVPDRGPHFICSDRPVSISWNEPAERGGFFSPGLGLTGTTVMFPVDRSHALVGLFEGEVPEKMADAEGIGIINMWTALFAKRFVYSADDNFTVTLNDGTRGGKEELLAMLAEQQQREGDTTGGLAL